MPFLALTPLLSIRREYGGGCIQYPSHTLPLKGEGKVVSFSLSSKNHTWTFRFCKGPPSTKLSMTAWGLNRHSEAHRAEESRLCF